MERFPPSCDLLNSIAQNTTRISMISYAKNTSSTMHRSDSSPAIVTMSNVHHMLSSNQQIFLSLADSKDYSLCCALAALLSNVYRIIDFAETSLERCPPPASTQDSNSVNDDDAGRNLYQRLCNRMSIIRYEQMSILSTSCLSSQGLADLWAETDRLMDAVYTLASSSHGTPPPSYHELYDQEDGRKGHVPAYDHTVSTAYNGKTQKDLDTLLSAIDRLGKVAPRLNDQRAEISDRQAGELAAATLGKTVDRLSRGRMEDQRATLASTKLKEDMLYDLMAQIYNLASRTFDNQRVFVGSRLQRKMDEATIFGIMDRSQRGRMTSQVYFLIKTALLYHYPYAVLFRTGLLVKRALSAKCLESRSCLSNHCIDPNLSSSASRYLTRRNAIYSWLNCIPKSIECKADVWKTKMLRKELTASHLRRRTSRNKKIKSNFFNGYKVCRGLDL